MAPGLTLHRLELFLVVLDQLGLLRGAEQAVADLRGLHGGSLIVGASTVPGTYLLPTALGRLHVAYPGIGLSLRIGDTREIERWDVAGQVELGVIGEAPLLPGLAAQAVDAGRA